MDINNDDILLKSKLNPNAIEFKSHKQVDVILNVGIYDNVEQQSKFLSEFSIARIHNDNDLKSGNYLHATDDDILTNHDSRILPTKKLSVSENEKFVYGNCSGTITYT